MLKSLAEVNINPAGCAFTQTMDNRAAVELWFADEKACSDNAAALENARKSVVINGQDF